jgi:hypothetical protein
MRKTMETLEILLSLCLSVILGLAGGLLAGSKLHVLRVREAIRLIEGKVDATVRYQWADRLWLRLLLLATGVVLMALGWQYLIDESTGLFLLTLVSSYWFTRARRANNNIADFS